MKKISIKRVVPFILITIVALCVPTSLAKYATTNQVSFKVKVAEDIEDPSIFLISGSGYASKPYEYQVTKTGQYVILVKGGDGGDGIVANNGKKVGSVPGGTGGFMSVKVNLTRGTYLECYVGPKGGNASVSSGGSGATVSSLGSGGSGSNSPGTVWGTAIAKWLSNEAASGGGGAASSIFVESSSKSSYSPNYSNLLVVAAGAGGGSGWDSGFVYGSKNLAGFHTVPSGMGGNGGGNAVYVTDSRTSSDGKGTVYFGGNGRIGSKLPFDYTYNNGWWDVTIKGGDANGKNKGTYVFKSGSAKLYGNGGTTVGGLAADASNYDNLLGSSSNAGNAFGASSDKGKGGKANAYGGPGGGGYCGGSSGTGASLDVSAGGGGGGSSYVTSNSTYSASTYDSFDSVLKDPYLDATKRISYNHNDYNYDKIYTVSSLTSSTLTEGDMSAYYVDKFYQNGSLVGDGFIIIKYLGPIS